jgi:hypothetical protein
MRALKTKGTPFMGGSSPNLADLAVYGVLSAIRGCRAFQVKASSHFMKFQPSEVVYLNLMWVGLPQNGHNFFVLSTPGTNRALWYVYLPGLQMCLSHLVYMF